MTTLPEGGSTGTSPLRSYRFALDLPVLTPPYFTEMHVNSLLPSPPGSHGRGLFYTDPRRTGKLLALELGAITVQGFTAVFTLHTLYVPHDAFLSYIAAHPTPPTTAVAAQPGSPPISDITVDVPWEAWGPSHTRLVTVPNVAHSRYLGLHKVCGMHALSEPPILLDRGLLRIMDYRQSRAARAAEQGDGSAGDDHSLPVPASSDAQANPLPVSPVGSATEEPRAPSGSSGDGAIARLLRRVPSPPPPPPPMPPPDTPIPYSVKDIPLPKELKSDSLRCVLGEDVVVLFEVGTPFISYPRPSPPGLLLWPTTQFAQFSTGNHEQPGQRIHRMFYHPI